MVDFCLNHNLSITRVIFAFRGDQILIGFWGLQRILFEGRGKGFLITTNQIVFAHIVNRQI